ncbi:hypothetical protein [Shewanella sp. GXUN23E]|uniref:hypothetical protein n=1 Tax=Shewanella sp. GXUN23E TaxID=3422498 RepID=UPI003D7CF6F4
MKLNTLAVLMCGVALSGSALAGSTDSSQKLSQAYGHIMPANSTLVHSKASSLPAGASDQLVRSLREEWYKDREGHNWYTWEEKQQQPDGHWAAIGSGIAKQGSDAYKPRP